MILNFAVKIIENATTIPIFVNCSDDASREVISSPTLRSFQVPSKTFNERYVYDCQTRKLPAYSINDDAFVKCGITHHGIINISDEIHFPSCA